METGTRLQRLTREHIAALAGVTPNTIGRWRAKYRDFPKAGADRLYDRRAVEEWLSKHGKNLPRQQIPREMDREYELTRAARALADVREFNLSVLEGQHVSRERFEESRLKLIALFMKHLREMPGNLAAELTQRDEDYIAKRMEDYNNGLRVQFNEELERGAEISDGELKRIREWLAAEKD